jgi:iron complex outermembrane receptor protein
MDLAQVEVIKGAASALYGSSALGGVVNLVSRRPGEEAEHEALLNQTSRGGTDAIVFLAAPLTERWGYTMLGGLHFQDERDLDADAWTDLPGYRRAVLRPRLFWDTERGQSLLVTAGATLEDREGGTLGGGLAPDGEPWVEALDTRRLDLGVVGRFLVGASLWRVRGSATEQRHGHRFGAEREDDRHRTGFVEATFTVPRERVSWLVGAALQRESYENVQVQGFDHTFTTGSAFAQADLTPAPWLGVAATVRVDEHSAYGTLLNPRLSALLRAPAEGRLRDWTLRASVGTGAFTPTPFTEETEVVGLRALAPWSPDGLDVERATTGSLDLGGPLGPIEVNATLFASIVRDPVATIEEVISPDTSRLRIANAPEATRTAGTELLARYVAGPWHVTGSYTYTRSTAWDLDDGVRRAPPLVPRHAAGVVGMYEVEERGRIGLELYYTGRQALEHNPYRESSRPYLIVGALLERHVGRARIFVNFENLTNVRQTRWDPLVLPARGRGGRWTTDAWTELSGRTVNGGVRLAF